MHCVWCRWALSELANSLRPQDRMKMQAKNYETLQEIASNFQKRALLTLSIQQQPVPLAYFHLLKLMLVFVNALISCGSSFLTPLGATWLPAHPTFHCAIRCHSVPFVAILCHVAGTPLSASSKTSS